jgi:hypothetical protein
MIDYMKYKRELAKLFKRKERVRSLYTDKIQKARTEGKSPDDINSLETESLHEDWTIDEEISILVTNYLIKKANRSFIPIPSHDEDGMWKKCNEIHNRYVLTSKGVSMLRTSMRLEMKEQYEMVLSLLTILIGIIGAATGLVAVFLK